MLNSRVSSVLGSNTWTSNCGNVGFPEVHMLIEAGALLNIQDPPGCVFLKAKLLRSYHRGLKNLQ